MAEKMKKITVKVKDGATPPPVDADPVTEQAEDAEDAEDAKKETKPKAGAKKGK